MISVFIADTSRVYLLEASHLYYGLVFIFIGFFIHNYLLLFFFFILFDVTNKKQPNSSSISALLC